jgi:hypothetical protein
MRLRLTIRDLFWLTLVAGIVVGWRADRAALIHQHFVEEFKIKDLIERLEYIQAMNEKLQR